MVLRFAQNDRFLNVAAVAQVLNFLMRLPWLISLCGFQSRVIPRDAHQSSPKKAGAGTVQFLEGVPATGRFANVRRCTGTPSPPEFLPGLLAAADSARL